MKTENEYSDEQLVNMCSHFDEFLMEFGENYDLQLLELISISLGRTCKIAIEHGHVHELESLLRNAIQSLVKNKPTLQ